jgi:hypothetical protein
MFDDEEEPMTKLINQMMNLEFICCILYGLNEVYNKKFDKIEKIQKIYKRDNSRISGAQNNSNSLIMDSNMSFEEK